VKRRVSRRTNRKFRLDASATGKKKSCSSLSDRAGCPTCRITTCQPGLSQYPLISLSNILIVDPIVLCLSYLNFTHHSSSIIFVEPCRSQQVTCSSCTMSIRLSDLVRVIPSHFAHNIRQCANALLHPQNTTVVFESISEEKSPFTFLRAQAATHNLAFGIEKFTMFTPPDARYSCSRSPAMSKPDVLPFCFHRMNASPCAKRGSRLA
jgi:hypothetical protein